MGHVGSQRCGAGDSCSHKPYVPFHRTVMGSTKLALHGVGLGLSELGPLPDRARQLLEAGVV